MVMTKKSMGDYLVSEGFVSQDQLNQALESQKATKGDLGKILVEQGMATERDVAKARAQEMGIPFVDLSRFAPEPSAVNVVPEHIAKRHNVIPVKKDSANNTLHVAMSDVNNPYAADDLRLVSRCTIRAVLASAGDIEDAIARVYGGTSAGLAPANGGSPGMNPNKGASAMPGSLISLINEDIAKAGSSGDMAVEDDEESAIAMADEAPIIRVANTVIQQAILESASDIHIEPEAKGLRIRYRVDGVLHETMKMPKYIQPPLISRFKIMAEMNIAERRIPQDGRIPVRFENKDYDLRVSCLPSLFGEKIVCRILD
jgi:type IV pilus assembly protein PilB